MGLSKLNCLKHFLKSGLNFSRVSSRLYSDVSQNVEDCATTEKSGASNEGSFDGSKKGLVLGVYEEQGRFELTPAAEEVNQKSGGKLCRHLNELSCELRLGKAFAVTDLLPEYSVVAITSFGPAGAGYNDLEALDEAKENIRWGVGAGVQVLQARGCGQVAVDCAAAPEAAAEAAHLAAWRFEEFKTVSRPTITLTPYLVGGALGAEGAGLGADEGGAGAEGSWETGAELGASQNWARYLCDMPANKMTPVDFAQAALDTLCPLGVRVTVREREWAAAQGMDAFLAVARGSCEPPLLLDCEYTPPPTTTTTTTSATQPVLLAAKGVTFDSGGLCLRDAARLAERGGAAGAAAALAALRALAALKVGVSVSAVVPLCENMVSGQCMKVGDVVRALNGLSIQIEDTDMEGRLLLADALVYGQAHYKPALVIAVASLTRGAARAAGGGAFGCFSNSEEAWAALRSAGAHCGDRPWRLPLWDYYSRQLTDEPAVDLRNRGSGTATACLAAAFLKNFVCGDWLHVDVSGAERGSGAPPYLRARRATGRPARALAYLLRSAAAASGAPASPATTQQ